jgi:dTMP kinase
MSAGKFITLEGGEGAGKSTQARKIAEYLKAQGKEVVLTREVGGCPSAEDIRALWLSKGEGYWDGTTEVLLISAARREHLVKVIWPALERGAWVISDRFLDSTRAYQGIGLGLGVEMVDHYYKHIAGKTFEPDLTLLLDLPVEVGMKRVSTRDGQDDRYQQKNIAFHQTLRDAYVGLALQYPARIKTVDAGQSAEAVSDALRAVVRQHFGFAS